MKNYIGVVAALISAFLFGITPVISKLTYDMGSNALMLTFLRSAIALPILYCVLKYMGVSLRLSRKEIGDVALIGIFGFSPTSLLLYSSYHYVPVGMATVLHFLFPVIVTLASIFIFKRKADNYTRVALCCSIVGIGMFLGEVSSGSSLGFVLALASAITYSFYILGVSHSSLAEMHYLKISFYFSLCSFVVAGIFAQITGNMTFKMKPLAWFYTFLISILVAIGAFTLLQLGIRECGAMTASILSTLEPITGVTAGLLLLNEKLSILNLVACIVIIAGVIVVTLGEGKKRKSFEQNE